MSIFSLFKKSAGPRHPRREPKYPEPISARALKDIFAFCFDFEQRELRIGGEGRVCASVCYLDGLVSGGDVSEDIIRPLTEAARLGDVSSSRECIGLILKGAVYSCSVKEADTLDELADNIVNGYCAVVFDAEKRAVCFETRTSVQRSIEQPSSEKAVKGAKDSFIETLRTNTSLVRRKLRSPELKVRQTVIGRKSRTAVAVMYCDGIADPARVDELLRRLDDIDVDGLTATGNLEEYVVSSGSSPFPQLMHTERPDRFAMNLLEGRVGLLIDGLPLGFLIPVTVFQLMKVPEDAAQHFLIASALTALRHLSFILSLLLPALLVAVAMYHQEMLPFKLLLSMIAAKQEVPFGVAVEVLGMLVSFELLQEAGLRLPDPVGQTVSIIGALIVGQSAVEARVVSPVAVIVVALAGICGYTIPSQDLSSALRLCRFLLVPAAIIAGMYGLTAGLALFVYHLAGIDSFGVEYLSPLSDRGLLSALRSALCEPARKNKYRDRALNTPDKRSRA